MLLVALGVWFAASFVVAALIARAARVLRRGAHQARSRAVTTDRPTSVAVAVAEEPLPVPAGP